MLNFGRQGDGNRSGGDDVQGNSIVGVDEPIGMPYG